MTTPANSHTYSATGNTFAERLHELVDAAKSEDPLQRVTVVTPGFFSSFYLRRWIAAQGLINVEFIRIEDIAEQLARPRIDEHGGRSLSRLEGAELVRAAVADSIGSSGNGTFSSFASQPSFLVAVQRTLRELEAEQGSAPISFAGLAAPSEVSRAISRVWETYQWLKSEQKLYDRTQVSGWAVEALDSGVLDKPETRLAVGRLVVLAAAMPAPQYRVLWQRLASSPRAAVLVATSGDRRSDAALAEAFGVEPVSVEDNGYLPVPSIVSALDARSEISGLVQRIAAAAKEGVAFNRIAVLHGDSSYGTRVRSALEMAGIPVSGPPRQTLGATPAGRFVSGILAIASSDMARQGVGDWLATCAVQQPGTKIPVTGSEWDRISKSARVTTGIDRWRSGLRRFDQARKARAEQIERRGDDESSSSGGARAADALRAEADSARHLLDFVESLASDLRQPGETATWTAWSGWLKYLVERYLHAPDGSVSAESADRISTLLDRIGELDTLRSSAPDMRRFAAVVTRELSETRSGPNRLGKGVFVASARDAAATRFEHVHMLGMSDGTFPSPDTADPLLPDHVREELNRICGTDLPRSGVRLALRRREFLAALMSGSKVTLHWSRSSGPGTSEAGPAQWLIEQARRIPGAEGMQAGDLLRRPESIPCVSVVEYGSGTDASDAHEFIVSSVKRHVETYPQETPHWLERDTESGVPAARTLESGRYGKVLTPWSGDLSSVAALVPSISGEVLSASRVESFAGCPLRYLFGYVLKVDPGVREDDSFHMAPDRRGTFIHSVLEAYLNLRIGSKNRPPGEETLDEAMKDTVAEWIAREPDVAGRVWELETAEIRRQLRRWLAAEAALEAQGYGPQDAELSFGRGSGEPGDEQLPPFEITLADSEVLQFSGMIDRVDRHSDGSFYVLDYKTGSSRSYSGLKDDPVGRGKHLQLALYSKAVEQFRPGAGRASAAYWFVMDGKQPMIPEPGAFDPVHAEQRLRDVLETMQASSANGYFPPHPGARAYDGKAGGFENCLYCEFDRVCPAGSIRDRMQSGHSEDPRLAPYFNLALGREGGTQ